MIYPSNSQHTYYSTHEQLPSAKILGYLYFTGLTEAYDKNKLITYYLFPSLYR